MKHVIAHIYGPHKGLQKHEWIVEDSQLAAVEATIAYMLGGIPKTLVFKEIKDYVQPKGSK